MALMCTNCNKGPFANAGNLWRHRKRCLNLRQFVCDTCPAGTNFNTREALRDHYLTTKHSEYLALQQQNPPPMDAVEDGFIVNGGISPINDGIDYDENASPVSVVNVNSPVPDPIEVPRDQSPVIEEYDQLNDVVRQIDYDSDGDLPPLRERISPRVRLVVENMELHRQNESLKEDKSILESQVKDYRAENFQLWEIIERMVADEETLEQQVCRTERIVYNSEMRTHDDSREDSGPGFSKENCDDASKKKNAVTNNSKETAAFDVQAKLTIGIRCSGKRKEKSPIKETRVFKRIVCYSISDSDSDVDLKDRDGQTSSNRRKATAEK